MRLDVRWWDLWKMARRYCPHWSAPSGQLMEGTCLNSWILPRIQGGAVSSYSVFLDSKGDCPKDKAGWHLQHRQEVRLLRAVALADVYQQAGF